MKRRAIPFALMGALAVGSLAAAVGSGPVGAKGHQKTSLGGHSKTGQVITFSHPAGVKTFSNRKSMENGKAAVTTTNTPTKSPTNTPPTTTPPTTIAADCSADVGQALGDWLSSLPASSTVTLRSGACYRIDSSLIIHNTSGLTINGKGSLISQTVPGGQGTDVQGILYLRQNANLTLNGLTVAGAFNGTNGGVSYEGNYGLFMEANHGVNVSGMNMSNIQGDFMILDPPQNNDTGSDQSLNTDVNIQSSTFTSAGYHGITIESVNGLTIEHSTFSNMGTDAIDAEYDVYSSAFDAQGNAEQAAQDNITIAGNTFTNFSNDFYASLQGQSPGVQQQNVNLSYNTIDGGSGLFEITGTNQYTTPSQYWNEGLIIAFNKSLHANVGTTGASCDDPPGGTAAMQIQYVSNVTISANSFPLFDGLPDYCTDTPYVNVIQGYGLGNFLLTQNNFTGAYNIFQAGSNGNITTECGNVWGVNGLQGDGACPSTTPPSTTPPSTTPPSTTPPSTTTTIPGLAGTGFLHTASSNLNANGGTSGSNSAPTGGGSWRPCSGSQCSTGPPLSAVS